MITRSKRDRLEGVVLSHKADKTITVTVPLIVKHPKYKKYLRKARVFHVHDEKNEAREGDRVQIGESRPLSKNKHWRLVKVLEKAQTV